VFKRAIQTLRDGVLSLAYPQDCRICSQPVESWNEGVVCAACWDNANLTRLFNSPLHCIKCHMPLPASQSFSSSNTSSSHPKPVAQSPLTPFANFITKERTCGQCLEMPFTFARACGVYAGALEANVLFIKSHPYICRRLREILVQIFAANAKYLLSDVVMPVPLHNTRKLERGFNQAEVLARLIASHFNMQLDNTTLKRNQHTERHRAGMDAFDRMKSVKGVFQVKTAPGRQNASVLLIDDVFTTGSTLCAATQTLLDAGARQVQVFTIAKVTQVQNHSSL
jgi:competence protein ComFC